MKILSKLWHFHLCVHFYQILYANISVFLPPSPSPYFPIIIFCDRLRLPPPPPPISPSSSSLIGCSFLHPIPQFSIIIFCNKLLLPPPHSPISPLSSSVISCFSFILLPLFPCGPMAYSGQSNQQATSNLNTRSIQAHFQGTAQGECEVEMDRLLNWRNCVWWQS